MYAADPSTGAARGTVKGVIDWRAGSAALSRISEAAKGFTEGGEVSAAAVVGDSAAAAGAAAAGAAGARCTAEQFALLLVLLLLVLALLALLLESGH